MKVKIDQLKAEYFENVLKDAIQEQTDKDIDLEELVNKLLNRQYDNYSNQGIEPSWSQFLQDNIN